MEKSFFDRISGFYDDMIGFEAALKRRAASLQKFISDGMEYAADAGCGTGLDSISLSRLGLKVRAFDISPGMIEEAEKNAKDLGAKIKFYNSSVTDIPDSFNNSFDLVVSLGNTMANIPPPEIPKAIKKLNEILKPGGRLIIQILNYEKLKINNERIVNITHKKNIYFIRFYDFLDDHINFNILKFNSENTKDRSMDTTSLYLYSPDELKILLQNNNFGDIEIFGNLDKDNFDDTSSSDLVASAYK